MPRKPNKRKFFQPKQGQEKRFKREDLTPGMTGFLISCSQGNENRSVLEVYDLLNEYMDVEMAEADTDAAAEVPVEAAAGTAKTEEEPEDDMEKAIADELKQYRNNAGIEERKARFKAVESGCNNLIFISSAVVDPSQFAYKILSDIHDGKKGKARYIQRLLPAVATCRADIDTIKKTGEKILSKYFSESGNPSFLFLYKTRNTALTLTRDDIITAFGEIVKGINPECKANLDDPDYAVSVDIIKTVCIISVAKNYTKLKKYNVHVDEEDGSQSRVQPIKDVTASEGAPANPEESKERTAGEGEVVPQADIPLVA